MLPEPEGLAVRRASKKPFNIPGNSAVDDIMVVSDVAKGPKQNFCLYCKTMQSQLPRHLIRKHLNKSLVEEFSNLPIKSPARQLIISKIRKEGNFLLLSKEFAMGKIIPVRRPAEANKCSGKKFTTCPSCKGLYTRNNIRHHFPQCAGKKSARNVIAMARATDKRIHPRALEVVREKILPRMHEDEVLRIIRNDLLIILYANALCQRHKKQYNYMSSTTE